MGWPSWRNVDGSGFKGLGFRVQDVGFRVLGLGLGWVRWKRLLGVEPRGAERSLRV